MAIAPSEAPSKAAGDLFGLDRFDFGRARHDVAVAPDLLGRVADPEGLLAALRRSLKAGGRLVTSVPDASHPAVRRALAAGASPYSIEGPLDAGQLHLFTRDSLVAAIEAQDFAVGSLRAILDPRDEGVAAGWIAVAHALPVPGLELFQERFREVAAARAESEVAAETLREILARTRLALYASHARAEDRADDARAARADLLQERENASRSDGEFAATIRELLARLDEIEPLRRERDAAHRHALDAIEPFRCERDAAHRHAIAAEARCRALEGRAEHILMEVPRRVARAIRNRLFPRSKETKGS